MNNADATQTAIPAARLPLSVCVGWGAGTLSVAALFNVVNVLLLRYLVDFVGVGAVLAGSLIGFSKIYDAVIDPAFGVASDRTRSRLGRRRPYLLGGGILLSVAALLLFNVPGNLSPGVRIGYVVFALVVYATGYAAFSVPYMAMPAEMTGDFHERSHLISFRIYAVAIASMIASFVGPVLISVGGGGQPGYTTMSLFIAAVVLVSAYWCFRTTARAPFHFQSTVRLPFLRKLALMIDNRPFMLLLAIKLTALMALAITQAAMPFLFKRVLHLNDTMLGFYFLTFYGVMILSQRAWIAVTRRLGKRNAYIVATLIYAAIYVSWYFVVPGEARAWLFVRAVVQGASGGGVLLLGQSLLPDTMEWDYRRTGLRREGMLSAVYTLFEKLAYALGAAITGIALGRSGYIQGTDKTSVAQPQSAIDAIYVLASFAPMALLLLSCFFLLFYRLSEETLTGPSSVLSAQEAR